MVKILIWILFFLSGACALIYEVLWMRHLGLILGNTVYSMSAVLSAFMGGLALGSFLSGRYLAKRSNPLMLYGILEIAIGIYCLALPWLFDSVTPLYTSLYEESGGGVLPFVRFALSFLLLLVPTTCMGATLPLLTQHLVHSPKSFSRIAGMLYAVNTFGAVLGAASAGFFLLPVFGRSWSNGIAVIVNLILGIIALILGSRSKQPEVKASAPDSSAEAKAINSAETEKEAEASAFTTQVAVIIFGITGGAAMATQIGWTRALSLSLGSSTYAFSLIVSIFILGLASGGAWGSRFAPKCKDPVGSLAHILQLIGTLNLSLVPLLGWGPLIFFWLISIGSQWGFGTLMLLEALGVGAFLIIPTFLMGAIMPLTLQIAHKRSTGAGGAGRTVGALYAVNTVGSIIGSLLGGLVLLPFLQIQFTLKLMAVLYAFSGLALFRLAPSSAIPSRKLFAGVLATLSLLIIFAPKWDIRQMSSGLYLMRSGPQTEAARRGNFSEANPFQDAEIHYHSEGASATVTVYSRPGRGLTLSIGGKPDASSTEDMTTQIGLTLIPQLLHTEGAKEILVIGMGSGVSLGAALRSPHVQRIDVLEISPEVMEASWFFRGVNGLHYRNDSSLSPLVEEKIRVLINDGRNHLRMTQKRYDVISSEPSNPWIAGIGNLFTKEAFELCRSRLNKGGIMCQWLHRYGMAESEFRSVLATFGNVFPHAQLWCVLPGSDYLLIGSDRSLTIPLQVLMARMEEPGIRSVLKSVMLDNTAEFMACFLADTKQVHLLGEGAVIHTDDNMLLEFAGPRTMIQGNILFQTANWRVSPERTIDFIGMSDERRWLYLNYLDLSTMGRWLFEMSKDQIGRSEQITAAVRKIARFQIWAKQESERTAHTERINQRKRLPNELDKAIRLLEGETLPGLEPDRQKLGLAMALENRAINFIDTGAYRRAEADIVRVTNDFPDRYEVLLCQALLAADHGTLQESLAFSDRAQSKGAPPLEALYTRCRAFLKHGQVTKAHDALKEILLLPEATKNPACAPLWALWAEVHATEKRPNEARRTMKIALGFLKSRSIPLERARIRVMKSIGGLEAQAEVVKSLQMCLVLQPEKIRAYLDLASMELELASAYDNANQKENALEHRRRARMVAHGARALAPKDPETYILLAQAVLALGEKKFALSILREARKHGGEDLKLPKELQSLKVDQPLDSKDNRPANNSSQPDQDK